MRSLGVKSFVYERDGDLMEAIADAMSETPSMPDDLSGAGVLSEFYLLNRKIHILYLKYGLSFCI